MQIYIQNQSTKRPKNQLKKAKKNAKIPSTRLVLGGMLKNIKVFNYISSSYKKLQIFNAKRKENIIFFYCIYARKFCVCICILTFDARKFCICICILTFDTRKFCVCICILTFDARKFCVCI